MTEAQIEILEKMFPKGFVIVAVQPNKKVIQDIFNPNKYEALENFWSVLNVAAEEMSNHDNPTTPKHQEEDDGEAWKKV